MRAERHLPLGTPSEGDEIHSVLIPRRRYVSLYRNQRHPSDGRLSPLGAEWVAYRTTAADVNHDLERPGTNAWQGEHQIPRNFAYVDKKRWGRLFARSEGLTRGHIMDSGASSKPDEMRSGYVLMTNAFPQWAQANAGAWHTLERDVRELARRGYDVYQYAGPVWQSVSYTALDGTERTLEAQTTRGIPVPSAFWKVAVAVPTHHADGSRKPLAEALAEARLFSVVVPNAKDDGLMASTWVPFAKSPREIEKLVGLEFFRTLPKDLRGALLDHVDRREHFDFQVILPKWKVKQLGLIKSQAKSVAVRDAARWLLANSQHIED